MTEGTAVVVKESEGIRTQAEAFLAEAAKIQVVDQSSSDMAQAVLVRIKDRVKAWKSFWKVHKDKAKDLLDGLRASEAELLDKADPVMASLSGKIVAWTTAEREKARIAKEAREKAEWEASQKEREAAARLENATTFEAAAAIMEKAKPTAPLPPAAVAPRTDDVQIRDHWVWEVDDFEKIPRQFLKTDDGMITRHVTEFKDKTNIPGIRVFNRPIVAAQPKRRV